MQAREAAKGIINEGVDAGELAGTSSRAESDDEEDPEVYKYSLVRRPNELVVL